MKHIIKTFFFLPFIFWNCATNVPISTSLNDFAMMGINSSETPVSFDVKNELKPQPNVETGVLKPYNKDKKGIRTDMFGYKLAPQNVFKTMFSEFMSNKYTNINSTNPKQKISINLKDFWIEYFTEEGAGAQVAVALVGGEVNYTIKAKANVQIIVEDNGNTFEKNIISSAEEIFIYGVGTGTNSSNIYKGESSAESKVGKATNSVFNKVIMIANKFLDNPGGKSENAGGQNNLDDLKKLKSLYDEGILTKEEFDAKKKQILGI